MIRVGFSITRLEYNNERGYSIGGAICAGHADFCTQTDAEAYAAALCASHDQNSYDVRTWITQFKSNEDPLITQMKPPFPPASSP